MFSVMRCLIRRYVTSQQRKAEDMGVTEDDVNEVKQAVMSFRSELFDILRNNGMKGVTSVAEALSRKERLRERRLLKDFNIDLVETVMEAFMKDPLHGSNRFSLIRRMTGGRRDVARRNWNQIVGAARSRQNPIGITMHAQSGSLKELREKVLKEQELPPMRGAKRFVDAARRVLEMTYAIEEEEPYSASTTPRSSIPQDVEQDEAKRKAALAKRQEARRKSADAAAGKEPSTSAAKEQKKMETTPKKEAVHKKEAAPRKEAAPKKETAPKKEGAPKRDVSPRRDVSPATRDVSPKRDVSPARRDVSPARRDVSPARRDVSPRRPGSPKREASPRRPGSDVPRKAAGKEPTKEQKKMETTPKKAMPRKPTDSASKGETLKEPSVTKEKTTPKKVLPRKPPDSAGKEPSASTAKEQKKMETTPKKLVSRKPPDSGSKVEAGKEPSAIITKEQKKMETTPKKVMPKKQTDLTSKVEVEIEPTTSVAKELKKIETMAAKKEAPRKPSESATSKVETGKVAAMRAALDEKQKIPSSSTDKGVRRTSVGSTDEALKGRRLSADVILDIETDPSQVKSKFKASEISSESTAGVKGLISSFDPKPTSSKTDQAPSLPKSPSKSHAKSPAKKSSAKVFPADDLESTTWI